jgi:hypothetical protein
MTYEGKHRCDRGGWDGGLGIARVAALAGVAATTAAILSVGFGAGTAQAWPGFGHKTDPKQPASDSAPTASATAAKTPFGHIIIHQPTGDGSYFSFNGTGKGITGLCLNPKGC